MTDSCAMRLLFFSSVLLTARNVIGQNTETLRFPGAGDSCNVINLNIGRGEEAEEQIRGPQGRPGKRGSVGLTGDKGNKGQKGDIGPPGISPEINMVEVTSAVLKALAATSCKQLMEDHGISNSGYYQMRTNETNFATYKYCDFQIHDGAYMRVGDFVALPCTEVFTGNTIFTKPLQINDHPLSFSSIWRRSTIWLYYYYGHVFH